jgi:CubicO group peptidase (beta-lactamase class C family)
MLGTAAGRAEASVYDVPLMSDISVDGSAEDWGDGGFLVEALLPTSRQVLPGGDFSATLRLAWDQRGLLVLLDVNDDTAIENSDTDALYWNDCAEVFAARQVGSPIRYQTILAPGADKEFAELRTRIYDHRPPDAREPELSVEAASRPREGGYTLEAVLAWDNLGLEPAVGLTTAFQIFIGDSDVARGPETQRDRLIWYPSEESWRDPQAMYALRLAESASAPFRASASQEFDLIRSRLSVSVVAAAALVGEAVTVSADAQVLATGELAAADGRSAARLRIDLEPGADPPAHLTVNVGDEPALVLTVPPQDQARLRELAGQDVAMESYCFGGPSFPGADLERPLEAENLIGAYSVEVDCYDRDFAKVDEAEEPGRYGAVVRITPEGGRPMVRYRTLFRLAEPIDWWTLGQQPGVEARLALPPQFGIGPEAAAAHAAEAARWSAGMLGRACTEDPASAVLFAGLAEAQPGGEVRGPADELETKDRQWWVTLKRKLYGLEERYPGALVCPRETDGDPAPVLRSGTAEEAGMAPAGVDAVDAVCREWAADSDQGFAVCVARHGVIVLHKAYGTRDGEPMTVTTDSWMASITKLLSGTLMMMLVDQGLVDLDTTVDTYLPPLRGIEVETPLTVRRLYNHTNGLWDHWGDEMNDLEQVIADLYPHLPVGVRHEYNGVGYAIGGRVIELISGEPIQRFYQSHLLGPLGCENTIVRGTYGDARSVPMDMAKIGQMLLNRGAYGNMRFFSEETFEKMLPRPLTGLAEQPGRGTWGVGTVFINEERPELSEPSPQAFGHGAASAATLIIDPEHDLIVVMTREAAGQNFGTYHPRFVTAVYSAAAEPAD